MSLSNRPAEGAASAYSEAWRVFARHVLLSVPIDITRDEHGDKVVRPLAKFKHVWDAEPSDAVVEELWAGREDAPGLAVLLTDRAGLFVIDTDTDDATDWAFELLAKTRTPVVKSMRGRKWLLQLNGLQVRSSSSELRRAVDIKAPNSLVILPPTPGYSWLPACSLDDTSPAPAPKRLNALLGKSQSASRTVAESPARGPVPVGRRHDTLVSLAGTMRRRDMDSDAILAALRVENELRCAPPVEDAEVVSIAESATWAPAVPLPRAAGPKSRTELGHVHETFRKHLYMPEPAALDAALAAFVAHRRGGDPCWLVVVGAPSGGKTEVIRAFKALPEVHEISSLTAQTFASGMSNRPGASLLARLDRDGKSFLTYKDLTTVLTLHRDARSEVFSQLREIYDGAFTKEFGTGLSVAWEGRLGFLAGVTNAIDSHHSVTALLGERFLYLRLPGTNRREQTRRALGQAGHEPELRAELRDAVTGYIDGLDLARETTPDTELIVALADFTTLVRTGVARDPHSGYEIAEVPHPEVPARFAKSLQAVQCALQVMGHGDPGALLRRIAYDSVPPRRLAALRALRHAPEPLATAQVADQLSLPTTSARRPLEELKALGLVGRAKAGKDDVWRLSELAIEVWAEVDPA